MIARTIFSQVPIATDVLFEVRLPRTAPPQMLKIRISLYAVHSYKTVRVIEVYLDYRDPRCALRDLEIRPQVSRLQGLCVSSESKVQPHDAPAPPLSLSHTQGFKASTGFRRPNRSLVDFYVQG